MNPRPAHWTGLLTERSMKFYDGTYKWDADGFWDEQGLYRSFSDYTDIEARPPTPQPPDPSAILASSSSDDHEGPRSVEQPARPRDQEETQSPERGATSITRPAPRGIKPLVPAEFLKPGDDAADAGVLTLGETTYARTLLRGGLFEGCAERERLLGRVEGVLVGQWACVEGLPLGVCYALCGIQGRDEILEAVGSVGVVGGLGGRVAVGLGEDGGTESKGNSSEADAREGPEDKQEASEDSLSECPSDLSDWDVADEVKYVSPPGAGEGRVKSHRKNKSGDDAGIGGQVGRRWSTRLSKSRPAA